LLEVQSDAGKLERPGLPPLAPIPMPELEVEALNRRKLAVTFLAASDLYDDAEKLADSARRWDQNKGRHRWRFLKAYVLLARTPPRIQEALSLYEEIRQQPDAGDLYVGEKLSELGVMLLRAGRKEPSDACYKRSNELGYRWVPPEELEKKIDRKREKARKKQGGSLPGEE
jgi:hypothetical protein